MDNHKDYIEDLIKDEADRIRAKLIGGKIYGKPVDMDNLNHLILASYLYGTTFTVGMWGAGGSNLGGCAVGAGNANTGARSKDGKP